MARRGNDCTVRAISKAIGKPWEEVYLNICVYGLLNHDMPSSNHVWADFLTREGWKRYIVPNTCCTTVRSFADEHKHGTYILALHGHVVTVIDGDYFDTWDSGDEVPVYYWKKV